MPVLTKQRHELFAQGIVADVAPPKAYVNAGFKTTSERSAEVASARLLQNVSVCNRIAELRNSIATTSEKVFVGTQMRDRSYRVSVLDEMLGRMLRLIKARAIDMKDIPGGDTGLLVRSFKSFGSAVTKISGEGQNMTERAAPDVREEYRFDSALAHEIREYTKEAGIEMGQRSEKQEVTLKSDAAPTTDYSRVPLETLLAAREKMLEAQKLLTIEAAPGSVEELSPEVEVANEPG